MINVEQSILSEGFEKPRILPAGQYRSSNTQQTLKRWLNS
jgi:hypothetical protein